MIKAERLRELMADRGLSQSELGRRVGVSQTAIGKLVSGESYGSKHLHLLARELGTTTAYLTGETDDASEGAVPMPTAETIAELMDLVPVASIDLEYGMGATFTNMHVEPTVQHFPRTWVETITRSPPALLTWARGKGDSMIPTINDGDLILIDRSQRRFQEQDAIWALSTTDDLGMIKRVRVRRGNVHVLSDNAAVAAEEYTQDEINVVGRVVFVGRRI